MLLSIGKCFKRVSKRVSLVLIGFLLGSQLNNRLDHTFELLLVHRTMWH